MTAHLLLITLGPVQDFIAQARRTRDLWYGSHLLSELGRAAARALDAGNARLIFPSLADTTQLEACHAPLRENGSAPQNIANKLLAEVPAGVDPEQLARAARKATADYWRDQLAAPVRATCAGLLANDIDAVWSEQIGTFLDFAASWTPLGESEGDYARARHQLEKAIAGRKLLRDFDAWTQGRGNVYKSSLDGARETVLSHHEQRSAALARKYRIANGEQLDAVGLVKRAGGDPEQFVPVANVALAAWLELASRAAGKELDTLARACREAGVSRVTRTDLPCVKPFPFDAGVLLANRWRAVFEERGLEGDALAWGRTHAGPVLRKLSEPYPYVACLVADGDRMGRTIDLLGNIAAHRLLSGALADFADSARSIVERQHRGALVYAGGDDVLAFVPVAEAPGCADALRRCFTRSIQDACRSLPDAEWPTLSVGLGIGHVMESMGDLLMLGRQAEREAKRDRNALAILVDKRSGGTRSWRASWSDEPVQALNAAIVLLRDRLSSRKVYEIASILARLVAPHEAADDGWARVLALEVKRALSRNESGSLRPNDVGLALDTNAGYAKLHEQVGAWVARLLIARTFEKGTPFERSHQEAAA